MQAATEMQNAMQGLQYRQAQANIDAEKLGIRLAVSDQKLSKGADNGSGNLAAPR